MEQIMTLGELASFVESEEVQKQIGSNSEDKIEVKISNRTMTVRSLSDERAEKLEALLEKIFDKRQEAYLELAKGPQ